MNTIQETLNTKKKKLVAFALSGALVLTLSTGIGYAANLNTDHAAEAAEQVAHSAQGPALKTENGKTGYSIDGGKTWSNHSPAGVAAGNDGQWHKVTASPGVAAGPYEQLAIKEEDGVILYSIDDGKTWSPEAPEGIVQPALPQDGESTDVRVNDDGSISFSTDGGKTWSAEAPEGMEITYEENNNGLSISRGTIGQ